MQNSFASLLRVRTALEMLASKYRSAKDFPRQLKIFNDGNFWNGLVEAEQVIAPLSEASYRLQRDENTMADVVISFRDIYVGFERYSDLNTRRSLIKCVEDKWKQCEQPMFILTFLLNPLTVEEAEELVEKSKIPAKIASSTQIAKFAVYYYRRLIGDDFGAIRGDIMKWIKNELTSSHVSEFDYDIVEFWQSVQSKYPSSLLPKLAIRLLSVAVNTATTERLFSELGMIQTARRNKMTSAKAQDTQRIQQHMRETEWKGAIEPTVKKILDAKERPIIDRNFQDGLEAFVGSPNAQTLQQEDGSLEDIGDGIDGDEIFPRWEEYFAEVFDDDELGTAFVASDSDSTYRGWEFEPIPEPDQTPYPALDDPNFPQENRVTGIRALKSSLAALFGSQE
eukprot:jgi/Phyca11/128309/e_gw1.75.29.1